MSQPPDARFLRVPQGVWASGGKRLFDIVGVTALLVLLSPLLLAVAILIAVDSPGSPFFVDDRVGRDGRRFRMWKFRTMVPNATAHPLGRKFVVGDPRVTRVGRRLRRLSLDELPQLFNILVGDMSIVGPRPGLWQHYAEYDDEQRQRLLVRPGVTGLAQVNGRNNLLWAERIVLDLEYIRTLSMMLDLRILLATVRTVFRGEGLYSAHQQRDTL